MMAAIIALAFVSAGFAAATVALAIRMQGMRGELAHVELQLAAAVTAATDSRSAAALANDAAVALRLQMGALEAKRRSEIDELQEIAARCAGPEEIRAWLTGLTRKGEP